MAEVFWCVLMCFVREVSHWKVPRIWQPYRYDFGKHIRLHLSRPLLLNPGPGAVGGASARGEVESYCERLKSDFEVFAATDFKISPCSRLDWSFTCARTAWSEATRNPGMCQSWALEFDRFHQCQWQAVAAGCCFQQHPVFGSTSWNSPLQGRAFSGSQSSLQALRTDDYRPQNHSCEVMLALFLQGSWRTDWVSHGLAHWVADYWIRWVQFALDRYRTERNSTPLLLSLIIFIYY